MEYLNFPEKDAVRILQSDQITTNKTTFSNGNILTDRYVIIGTILFFLVLFIIAVAIHIVKSYRDSCCQTQESQPYAPLESTNEDADDDDSLIDFEDSHPHSLYTSCHLCVDDAEVNTASASVSVVTEDCDIEYDCSSLANSVVGLEDSLIKSQEENVPQERSRSLSAQLSSKISSIFGKKSSVI